MYFASLCRSAIHAPRICNSIGQCFGFRRHRIFVPETIPKSCNRCRIAGDTWRECTVQSVPVRSRCSGIGSGHISSISTNSSCSYSMQKAANMFLHGKSTSICLFCLPVPIETGFVENTDKCQSPERQSQRKTKQHRFPFLFQTKQSEYGCSVLP